MNNILEIIKQNQEIKILVMLVLLDSIFGLFRSIKEKKINSNIGIDGLIRKFGMLISVIFFLFIDYLLNFNLIEFIPEEVKNYLGIAKIGISTLFIIIFILYESLSILKNMIKCKLPIPKKLQSFLEKIFNKFTEELKEGEVKNEYKIKRN